jgi:hypothetical protein
MVKVESGAVAPLPMVTAAVPVIEAPALAQGLTPAVVDLTLDDSPVDKGKQVVGVEEVEAVDQAGPFMAIEGAEAADQAGPSMAPEGDLAGAPAAWPDLAGLALVRAEEELPCWGCRPSSSETHPTLARSLSSRSMMETRCSTGSTSRVSGSTRCGLFVWLQRPCHEAC